MKLFSALVIALVLTACSSQQNALVDSGGRDCDAAEAMRTMLSKLTRWKTCTATIDGGRKKLKLEHVESKGLLKEALEGESRAQTRIHLCAEKEYGEPYFCLLFNPFERGSDWATSCEEDQVEFKRGTTRVSFLRGGKDLEWESTEKTPTANKKSSVPGYAISCTDQIQYTPSDRTAPVPF